MEKLKKYLALLNKEVRKLDDSQAVDPVEDANTHDDDYSPVEDNEPEDPTYAKNKSKSPKYFDEGGGVAASAAGDGDNDADDNGGPSDNDADDRANTVRGISPLLKNSYASSPKKKKKHVPGYADGGEINPGDDILTKFSKSFRKMTNAPDPIPSKEDSREDKNNKIRQENSERMSGKREDYDPSQDKGYADGGAVEDRRASLKALFPNKSDDEITSVMARADNPEQYVQQRDVGMPSIPSSVQDPLDPYKKFAAYTKQQNYAIGGPVVSDNPLKQPAGPYVPMEKKYPLNIGRIKPLNFKRKLKPIDIIKGYANGGGVIEGDEQQINPSLLETQYAPEEQDAQNSADSSVDGQLQAAIDDHNDQHNVVQQINAALGDKPENDTQELPSARELSGLTLDKKEALDENPEESPEDRIASRKVAAQESPVPFEKDPSEEDLDKKTDQDKAAEAKMPKDSEDEEETPKKPGVMDRLSNAQDAERKAILFNQLGKITDNMAASMGGYKSNNGEIYDQNIKNASMPVEQLKQQIAMEPYDPNSDVSKAFKKYLQKFGGKDMMPDGPVSAAMGKELMPFAFKDFEATQKAQEIKANNQERLQERLQAAQIAADSRKDIAHESNETKKMFLQSKADSDQEKKEAKKQHEMDAEHSKTVQQLEQMRGSPAVGRAEQDIYAADKADDLMNLYGDPNKLSMPQVKLLASEIGKIATGGVPTVEELKGITPNSLVGGLSTFASNLINKPTPAHAAEFIKRYKDYMTPLRKTAQQVIQDRYGRIIESKKSILGPDHYQELQDKYINRFLKPAGDQSNKVKQDPKINDYAQKYTNGDYNKAAAILKARGYNAGQ